MATWWVKQLSQTNTHVTVTSNASDPLDIAGPYATEALAQQAADKVNAEGGAGASLGTIIGTIPGAVSAGLSAGPTNPLAGVAAIGDFFNRLTSSATWLRVLEVLVGAGLFIVGLAKLAAGTQLGRAAASAGKAAAIL